MQPDDIRINVTKAGLCHSDAHHGTGEWGGTGHYPLIPGHEIVGRITHLGDTVKGFEIGERVAFATFRGCCEDCSNCVGCSRSRNDACTQFKGTYDPYFGGWATSFQGPAGYYYKVPEGIPDDAAAVLMCAGMTLYSPLRDHGFIGAKIAVVGIGGLGHMGIKFGAAMGMHVTAISTSEAKREEALSFGAADFFVSTDEAQGANHLAQFDVVYVAANSYKISDYIKYVKPFGKLCLLGAPALNCEMGFHPF
jgi:D-arabinose 1-dehydrogenase-like Zn-dependent alcohol dehydrogenase